MDSQDNLRQYSVIQKKSPSGLKLYQDRYFILDQVNGVLVYYPSQKVYESNPDGFSGIISLLYAKEIVYNGKKEQCINSIGKKSKPVDRQFEQRFPKEEIARTWVHAISTVVATFNIPAILKNITFVAPDTALESLRYAGKHMILNRDDQQDQVQETADAALLKKQVRCVTFEYQREAQMKEHATQEQTPADARMYEEEQIWRKEDETNESDKVIDLRSQALVCDNGKFFSVKFKQMYIVKTSQNIHVYASESAFTGKKTPKLIIPLSCLVGVVGVPFCASSQDTSVQLGPQMSAQSQLTSQNQMPITVVFVDGAMKQNWLEQLVPVASQNISNRLNMGIEERKYIARVNGAKIGNYRYHQSGWISKRGTTLSLKPWRERYFILDRDKLLYFTNYPSGFSEREGTLLQPFDPETDRNVENLLLESAQGYVSCASIQNIYVHSQNEDQTGCLRPSNEQGIWPSDVPSTSIFSTFSLCNDIRPIYFTLVTHNRAYQLQTNNAVSALQWVNAIADICTSGQSIKSQKDMLQVSTPLEVEYPGFQNAQYQTNKKHIHIASTGEVQKEVDTLSFAVNFSYHRGSTGKESQQFSPRVHSDHSANPKGGPHDSYQHKMYRWSQGILRSSRQRTSIYVTSADRANYVNPGGVESFLASDNSLTSDISCSVVADMVQRKGPYNDRIQKRLHQAHIPPEDDPSDAWFGVQSMFEGEATEDKYTPKICRHGNIETSMQGNEDDTQLKPFGRWEEMSRTELRLPIYYEDQLAAVSTIAAAVGSRDVDVWNQVDGIPTSRSGSAQGSMQPSAPVCNPVPEYVWSEFQNLLKTRDLGNNNTQDVDCDTMCTPLTAKCNTEGISQSKRVDVALSTTASVANNINWSTDVPTAPHLLVGPAANRFQTLVTVQVPPATNNNKSITMRQIHEMLVGDTVYRAYCRVRKIVATCRQALYDQDRLYSKELALQKLTSTYSTIDLLDAVAYYPYYHYLIQSVEVYLVEHPEIHEQISLYNQVQNTVGSRYVRLSPYYDETSAKVARDFVCMESQVRKAQIASCSVVKQNIMNWIDSIESTVEVSRQKIHHIVLEAKETRLRARDTTRLRGRMSFVPPSMEMPATPSRKPSNEGSVILRDQPLPQRPTAMLPTQALNSPSVTSMTFLGSPLKPSYFNHLPPVPSIEEEPVTISVVRTPEGEQQIDKKDITSMSLLEHLLYVACYDAQRGDPTPVYSTVMLQKVGITLPDIFPILSKLDCGAYKTAGINEQSVTSFFEQRMSASIHGTDYVLDNSLLRVTAFQGLKLDPYQAPLAKCTELGGVTFTVGDVLRASGGILKKKCIFTFSKTLRFHGTIEIAFMTCIPSFLASSDRFLSYNTMSLGSELVPRDLPVVVPSPLNHTVVNPIDSTHSNTVKPRTLHSFLMSRGMVQFAGGKDKTVGPTTHNVFTPSPLTIYTGYIPNYYAILQLDTLQASPITFSMPLQIVQSAIEYRKRVYCYQYRCWRILIERGNKQRGQMGETPVFVDPTDGCECCLTKPQESPQTQSAFASVLMGLETYIHTFQSFNYLSRLNVDELAEMDLLMDPMLNNNNTNTAGPEVSPVSEPFNTEVKLLVKILKSLYVPSKVVRADDGLSDGYESQLSDEYVDTITCDSRDSLSDLTVRVPLNASFHSVDVFEQVMNKTSSNKAKLATLDDVIKRLDSAISMCQNSTKQQSLFVEKYEKYTDGSMNWKSEKDLYFKPSTTKSDPLLDFIPTNLHQHMTRLMILNFSRNKNPLYSEEVNDSQHHIKNIKNTNIISNNNHNNTNHIMIPESMPTALYPLYNYISHMKQQYPGSFHLRVSSQTQQIFTKAALQRVLSNLPSHSYLYRILTRSFQNNRDYDVFASSTKGLQCTTPDSITYRSTKQYSSISSMNQTPNISAQPAVYGNQMHLSTTSVGIFSSHASKSLGMSRQTTDILRSMFKTHIKTREFKAHVQKYFKRATINASLSNQFSTDKSEPGEIDIPLTNASTAALSSLTRTFVESVIPTLQKSEMQLDTHLQRSIPVMSQAFTSICTSIASMLSTLDFEKLHFAGTNGWLVLVESLVTPYGHEYDMQCDQEWFHSIVNQFDIQIVCSESDLQWDFFTDMQQYILDRTTKHAYVPAHANNEILFDVCGKGNSVNMEENVLQSKSEVDVMLKTMEMTPDMLFHLLVTRLNRMNLPINLGQVKEKRNTRAITKNMHDRNDMSAFFTYLASDSTDPLYDAELSSSVREWLSSITNTPEYRHVIASTSTQTWFQRIYTSIGTPAHQKCQHEVSDVRDIDDMMSDRKDVPIENMAINADDCPNQQNVLTRGYEHPTGIGHIGTFENPLSCIAIHNQRDLPSASTNIATERTDVSELSMSTISMMSPSHNQTLSETSMIDHAIVKTDLSAMLAAATQLDIESEEEASLDEVIPEQDSDFSMSSPQKHESSLEYVRRSVAERKRSSVSHGEHSQNMHSISISKSAQPTIPLSIQNDTDIVKEPEAMLRGMATTTQSAPKTVLNMHVPLSLYLLLPETQTGDKVKHLLSSLVYGIQQQQRNREMLPPSDNTEIPVLPRTQALVVERHFKEVCQIQSAEVHIQKERIGKKVPLHCPVINVAVNEAVLMAGQSGQQTKENQVNRVSIAQQQRYTTLFIQSRICELAKDRMLLQESITCNCTKSSTTGCSTHYPQPDTTCSVCMLLFAQQNHSDSAKCIDCICACHILDKCVCHEEQCVACEMEQRTVTLYAKLVYIQNQCDQLQSKSQQYESKDISLHCRAAALVRAMGGTKVVSCKSAKDRTSMAITLEQARATHNLGDNYFNFHSLLTLLRTFGVRRANVIKNTGKKKYAFNGLQRSMLPAVLTPPASTCSGKIET